MRRWVYGPPLLLALLSFLPALRGGFVLDDTFAIVDNPVVTGALPARAALSRTFWGRPLGEPPTAYRPLCTLLFRAVHALFGLSALAFHATTLLLYLALCGVAVWLSRLWLDRGAACLAGCLFAASPLHAENAASLVGAADTLSLLLSLLSLAILRPALAGGRAGAGRIAGASACFALALLAKEGAAPLPLVCAALLVASGPPPLRERLRRLGPAAALLGVLGVYLGLRLWLVPLTFHNYIADDVLAGAGLGARLLYSASILAGLARLLLVPLGLCTGRKYAEVALPDGLDAAAVGGIGLLVLTLLAAVADLRRGRPPLLLCALLCWSVYSSLVFSMPEAMADRFLLAPSYFFLLSVAGAVSRLAAGRPCRLVPAFALACAWATLSLRQADSWRSTRALLLSSVRSCPDSVHNHLRLGDELAAAGDHAEAAWHYVVARQGRRHFPRPWHHPALDAERQLPATLRLRHLPELLGAAEGERLRAEMGAFLLHLGRPAEARLVLHPP